MLGVEARSAEGKLPRHIVPSKCNVLDPKNERLYSPQALEKQERHCTNTLAPHPDHSRLGRM
jgi:hypothetical protein